MSRYSKKLGNKVLVYGHDHALGYFYEVLEGDKVIEEKCVFFHRLSRNEMFEKMKTFKVDDSHIYRVALDLPF